MKVKTPLKSLEKLIDVVKQLRTPITGCPWDLEQDHKSLRPYMIEEAYEAVEAIDTGESAKICDELGDVLLQVVLHSQIAQDNGEFDLGDVAENVAEKMIRRHPHVFGSEEVNNSAEVLMNWEAIKIKETKAASKEAESDATPYSTSLKKVPPHLPALLRAQRVGGKAAKVGFDWSEVSSVFEKVKEEISELEEVLDRTKLSSRSPGKKEMTKIEVEQLTEELGDVLFSLCQFSRWMGQNAEDCLRESTSKFLNRFEIMETIADQDLSELDEKSLEELWQRAKISSS
jgi:MazG family protein